MTTGARIGVGAVGVLLLFVGWVARTIIEDTTSLGYVVIAAPDGVTGAYLPDVSLDGPFEIEETGEVGVFEVVHRGSDVVFTGTEEEAAFWIETRGAEPSFTGTRAEVDAWVEERQAEEDDFFWSNVLLVGGALILLGAVALGRTSKVPA